MQLRTYLLLDSLIVLQEPLQSRPVGMELGLDIRGRQEPSLAAIQGLSKPRPGDEMLRLICARRSVHKPVSVEWHPRAWPSHPE